MRAPKENERYSYGFIYILFLGTRKSVFHEVGNTFPCLPWSFTISVSVNSMFTLDVLSAQSMSVLKLNA